MSLGYLFSLHILQFSSTYVLSVLCLRSSRPVSGINTGGVEANLKRILILSASEVFPVKPSLSM